MNIVYIFNLIIIIIPKKYIIMKIIPRPLKRKKNTSPTPQKKKKYIT